MRRSTFNIGIVVVTLCICGWLIFGDTIKDYMNELAVHQAESLVEQLMR